MATRQRLGVSVAWLLARLIKEGDQKALAHATGLTQGYISSVLAGRGFLREPHRQAIADFAGVQPSDVPFVPDATNRQLARKFAGTPSQAVRPEVLSFLDEDTTPMPETKLRAFWQLASPEERRLAVEFMLSHWRGGTLTEEHAPRGRLSREQRK